MKYLFVLRGATFALCTMSVVLNVITWRINKRSRRALKEISRINGQMNMLVHDAWRGGLEEAACAVGKLAERTSGIQPDFTAILRAESVIHDLIRATEQHRSAASEK